MEIQGLDSRIHELTARLYDAALKPEDWPTVLDDMAALCGGMGVTVFPLKPAPDGFAYVSGSVAEAAGVYFGEWLDRCPRMAYEAKNPIYNRCFWDGDILDEATLRNDPYFHDYAASYDLQYSVIRATTALSGGIKHVISTPYSLQTGKPSDENMQLFAMLSDHAVRAMTITQTLGTARSTIATLSHLLDNRNCGVLILNAAGYVTEMNELAALLTQDGLLVVGKRLQTSFPALQQQLNRMIATALAGDPKRPAEPIAIRRSMGRLPLIVQATPLSKATGHSTIQQGFGHKGIVMTINDPERQAGQSLEKTFRMLGLTPAEARVADLLSRGSSPQDVADTLALSTGTVRNHLKSIFAKLEFTRQSELVALAGRISGLNPGI